MASIASASRTGPAVNTNFTGLLQQIVHKLQHDPSSITPEDGRRLHEHYDATDERSARIISAIEALALANPDIMATNNTGDAAAPCSLQVSLLTLLKDLHATLDASPAEVTPEILKLTQTAVSKMQKAVGHTSAPHPELEDELQKVYREIAPKVDQGIVTKEEADHLHSLEARAHGHTEKGGLTAVAQSVAAKRERALSLSGSSTGEHTPPKTASSKLETAFKDETAKVEAHMEKGTVTVDEANRLRALEIRVHGHVEKGGLAAQAQSLAAKQANLADEQVKIASKVVDSTVTKKDAEHLQSLEIRAFGHTEKGGLTAAAQSVAYKHGHGSSLKDASNGQGGGLKTSGKVEEDKKAKDDSKATIEQIEVASRVGDLSIAN
ncbi:hypothetical protein EJ04DRAFT_580453 [Polyplosphaeria fusca]|uniref:SMP domain-containing protein n=1 Tax=Polyplosphaeria fusca TaxID=682080 RepID=A0A9P4QLQ4_9PLEO|nr:hypothetical protein EJ04DRAFT_580453 [Polyplosphaeria fusca]